MCVHDCIPYVKEIAHKTTVPFIHFFHLAKTFCNTNESNFLLSRCCAKIMPIGIKHLNKILKTNASSTEIGFNFSSSGILFELFRNQNGMLAYLRKYLGE